MPFGQQDKLRRLIAASATFQAEVGVGTQALALPFVHRFQALEEFHSGSRAVIRFTTHESDDEGRGNWYSKSSLMFTIDLWRDRPANDATALATQEDEVIGKFGDIQQEMMDQQGIGVDDGATFIRVTRFHMLDYDMEGVELDTAQIEDPDDAITQQVCWWMRWEVDTR